MRRFLTGSENKRYEYYALNEDSLIWDVGDTMGIFPRTFMTNTVVNVIYSSRCMHFITPSVRDFREILKFMSGTVEGKDFEIIKMLDFKRFALLLICMETQELGGSKREDFKKINDFLIKKGISGQPCISLKKY